MIAKVSVKGQTVIPEAIREMARRRAAETEARANLQTRQSTRAVSLADFQSRQRSRNKIDLLSKEEHARQALRDAALGEADAEDRGGTAALTVELDTILRTVPKGVS